MQKMGLWFRIQNVTADDDRITLALMYFKGGALDFVSDCYDKAVSASRGERGLRAASTRLRVKLRVSGCLRGLGHARGLGSENTS